MPLTDVEIRQAKAGNKRTKLTVGNGLYLDVRPSGSEAIVPQEMVNSYENHTYERIYMARAMICVGDTTTHGGRVLEGTATATIDGKPIAGVGHKVLCPQCKGVFPILPATGRRYPHNFGGRETAIEGMKTACGATLIASQSSATLDDVGAGEATTGAAVANAAAALAPSPTLCLECLKSAAENAATMIARG